MMEFNNVKNDLMSDEYGTVCDFPTRVQLLSRRNFHFHQIKHKRCIDKPLQEIETRRNLAFGNGLY